MGCGMKIAVTSKFFVFLLETSKQPHARGTRGPGSHPDPKASGAPWENDAELRGPENPAVSSPDGPRGASSSAGSAADPETHLTAPRAPASHEALREGDPQTGPADPTAPRDMRVPMAYWNAAESSEPWRYSDAPFEVLRSIAMDERAQPVDQDLALEWLNHRAPRPKAVES